MQARSEETRAHLLEAARRLFASAGYNAASVDEICAEAGVSKGAFYHHFPSKQAIFLELLESWLQTVDEALESARQPGVPETLLGMADRMPDLLTSARGQLPMFFEFWLQASRDETVRAASLASYQRYLTFFSSLVEDGIRAGSFRPVDSQSSAQMIVSLAVGTLLQALLEPHNTTWQRTIHENMTTLLKGLAKP